MWDRRIAFAVQRITAKSLLSQRAEHIREANFLCATFTRHVIGVRNEKVTGMWLDQDENTCALQDPPPSSDFRSVPSPFRLVYLRCDGEL
jgi:hypothetical protein